MRELTRRREPTRPGEILREEFLIPLGMTQRQLAAHLGCDVKVINRIVNGRSSVTAEMALKLARRHVSNLARVLAQRPEGGRPSPGGAPPVELAEGAASSRLNQASGLAVPISGMSAAERRGGRLHRPNA